MYITYIYIHNADARGELPLTISFSPFSNAATRIPHTPRHAPPLARGYVCNTYIPYLPIVIVMRMCAPVKFFTLLPHYLPPSSYTYIFRVSILFFSRVAGKGRLVFKNIHRTAIEEKREGGGEEGRERTSLIAGRGQR